MVSRDEMDQATPPADQPAKSSRARRLGWVAASAVGLIYGLLLLARRGGWWRRERWSFREDRSVAGGAERSPPWAPSHAPATGPGTENSHGDGETEHASVRHEATDVNVWWVAGTLLAIAAVFLGTGFSIWFFLQDQRWVLGQLRRSVEPLAKERGAPLPPAPRLEPLDVQEGIASSNVYQRQVEAERILHSYGPSPETEDGFVHIPVEEAMKQLDGQLPVRPQRPSFSNKDNGLLGGGESNSGRLFREEPRW